MFEANYRITCVGLVLYSVIQVGNFFKTTYIKKKEPLSLVAFLAIRQVSTIVLGSITELWLLYQVPCWLCCDVCYRVMVVRSWTEEMDSWLYCKHIWLLVAVLAAGSIGAQDSLQCIIGINTPGGKLTRNCWTYCSAIFCLWLMFSYLFFSHTFLKRHS